MASLRIIRRRIASVKSTQKITRAMKMVAAARLRRAQDAIVAARPYAKGVAEAVAEVSARAGGDAHPLFQGRPGRHHALVTLGSDRGLAGGFNTNVGRATLLFIAERPDERVSVFVVGRKGREFLRRRKANVAHDFAAPTGETAVARAREIAATVTQEFLDGRIDTVKLVYNEFKSAIQQRVVVVPLIPVLPTAPATEAAPVDFLYEPGRAELLDRLLPLYVESQILRALLESVASEFGARMTAMDSATKNAKEMIDRLTLQYNRARQASITKELMEIVGGAEALKG